MESPHAQCSCVTGAATPDIISQYVGCIKALREVDPAGILLNAVGGPIKAYLRSRRDTIRCILASLTDDHDAGEAAHSESLFEELQQPPQPEVSALGSHRPLACWTFSLPWRRERRHKHIGSVEMVMCVMQGSLTRKKSDGYDTKVQGHGEHLLVQEADLTTGT